VQAAQATAELPLYVCEDPMLTTIRLRADVARLRAQTGLQLIVVDYLKLLADEYGSSEEQRIAHISAELKRIARQYQVHVLAIHSLDKVGLNARHPDLGNLRDSGQLAYDPDLVTLLKREDLNGDKLRQNVATLLVKLYDQFGDDFDDDTSRIPVTLSRRELADLVSTSFETTIRVMSRWDREGVLETTPDGFTIHDLGALQAAGGAAAVPDGRPVQVLWE